MKYLFCLGALLAAAITCVQAALPGAERLLPADTLGFVTVPDWSATRSNFTSSAMGQFIDDPAMKPFRDKVVANFITEKAGVLEKQLGIKLADYAELVRGQMTFALVRNQWDGSLTKKPGFLWLIDTRDKSAQARTNLADLRKQWIDKGNKIRADKIRDVEFTTFIIPASDKPKAAPDDSAPEKKPAGPTELLVGQSDTLLVISDSAKDAEKVLALQAGSSVPPLAEQAAFAANATMARDSGAFLWVDVKAIVNALIKQARDERSANPPPTTLLGAAPTLDGVLGAMGLTGVQTLAANFKDGADGSALNFAINAPESARKGLLRILAVDQKDASPPPFVPADAVKFNRWRIDLQKAWSTIENMLNEISPLSGGSIKMLLDIAGKDKDPNFDLRKVLLANLGDDLISYEKAPRPGGDPAKPPTLMLIGAQNADQMAASLRALTSIIPPSMSKFQEREFLGRKLCTFTMPSLSGGDSSLINYTASAGYVAISSDASLVEEFLRSNEGKNKPLRETVGLTEAAQRVGGMNTGFFAYENQNESMRATFENAKKNPNDAVSIPGGQFLSSLKKDKDANSVTNWFDPALLPAYDKVSKYFHLAVTAVNVGPNAITFKVFSPTPPALRK